jgi:hypothetical protein
MPAPMATASHREGRSTHIKRQMAALLLVLGGAAGASRPLYPVYWNVNGWSGYTPEGSAALPVAISKFGFMPENQTTTGGGCTMAGCQGCNHSLDCEPYPCPQKYWRGCWQVRCKSQNARVRARRCTSAEC